MKICPYAKKCGSCTYQGMEYNEQLDEKLKLVNRLIGSYCKVDEIIGMKRPFNYRNKVTASFRRLKNGEIVSGTYMEGTHNLVAIDKCQIENEIADNIIATIRKLMKSFKIQIYNEDTGTGLLRYVMIRRGHNSGQVMVILVLGTTMFPSRKNFIKELRKIHPEITTIVQNVNNKTTSMVLGDREEVLYGKGFISDTLCGYNFKISAKSFYQVNTSQTEILYNKAIELGNFTGKERILDAYCGIGTIGITASKKVTSVVGVESNKSAIKDAITNAKYNYVSNVKFVCEDAGEYMEKATLHEEKFDAVIMDPPRSGSSEQFLSSLVKLSPNKVIYISCGPESLSRDLKYLSSKGYKAEKAVAVDLFPWTEHVETIVALHRTNS